MTAIPDARVTSVATTRGEARLHAFGDTRAVATVVLGHGAGGGVEARDLQAIAAMADEAAMQVILFEQPWRVAGRMVAPAPAALDDAWLSALEQQQLSGALILGGRSAGARVACRTARRLGADAVIALAFPLHPPGKPEKSRAGELAQAGVPVLVVQGEKDPFGRPGEIRASAPGVEVMDVAGARHGLEGDLSDPLAGIADFVRRRVLEQGE